MSESSWCNLFQAGRGAAGSPPSASAIHKAEHSKSIKKSAPSHHVTQPEAADEEDLAPGAGGDSGRHTDSESGSDQVADRNDATEYVYDPDANVDW